MSIDFSKLIKPPSKRDLEYKKLCEDNILARRKVQFISPNNPTNRLEEIKIFRKVDCNTFEISKDLFVDICGYTYYLDTILAGLDNNLAEGKYGIYLGFKDWVPDANVIIKEMVKAIGVVKNED